jgi:DNA-binding CsgD family transcriptional regulator
MVCHEDGSRNNNHFTNLRWDTSKGNVDDMQKHGTHASSNRTECPHGHPYDSENTIRFRGRRSCRACRNRMRRRRRAETSSARAKRLARDKVIVRMEGDGASQKEIAAAVGLTQAGVSAALKRIAREAASGQEVRNGQD